MSSEKPKIESLLKLLNDEDDIAGAAMIQLLKHYQNELDSILKVLQECDIVLLRKRSHQLQALLTFKERRKYIADIFHRRSEDFFISDALFEFHLLPLLLPRKYYADNHPHTVMQTYSYHHRR